MNGDVRFGVVVNARDAWPDASELTALGAACVRTIAHDFDELEVALLEHPPDVRVIVTLTPRHPGVGRDLSDLSGWTSTVRQLVERFGERIWALECLSAWDTLDVDAATAVACATAAGRIMRDTGSGIAVLLGSVAGPRWLARLQEVGQILTRADRELLAGACFHPQKKNARGFPGFDHRRFEHGEIDVSVQDAHDIVQLPIWITEFGLRLTQAGGEVGQARFVRDAIELLGDLPGSVLAAATYNCWSDLAGAPHERGEHARGLRREDPFDPAADKTPRRAWHAFAEATGGSGIPPELITPGHHLARRKGSYV